MGGQVTPARGAVGVWWRGAAANHLLVRERMAGLAGGGVPRAHAHSAPPLQLARMGLLLSLSRSVKVALLACLHADLAQGQRSEQAHMPKDQVDPELAAQGGACCVCGVCVRAGVGGVARLAGKHTHTQSRLRPLHTRAHT